MGAVCKARRLFRISEYDIHNLAQYYVELLLVSLRLAQFVYVSSWGSDESEMVYLAWILSSLVKQKMNSLQQFES